MLVVWFANGRDIYVWNDSIVFFLIKQVAMFQKQQHKNGRMKDLWTT